MKHEGSHSSLHSLKSPLEARGLITASPVSVYSTISVIKH